MSLEQIALTTNKSISNVGDFVRKIGQGERGQVLPVLVTDASGSPYDLTNKKLVFSETKDSRMYVVDDGQATDAGKFNPTDPKNGKFSYTLQEQVYLESGTAWFDIVSQDGTVLDTTNAFRFVVIPDPTVNVKNGNYSSTLSALQAHYQAVISKTETNTQQLIDSLNDQITQAISNDQKEFAEQLTKIKDLIQQAQTEYGNKKEALDKLVADWQAQTKAIQDSADKQKQAIQDAADQQQKAIKDNADQQSQSIQTAADKQQKDIKASADQQSQSIQDAADKQQKAIKDSANQQSQSIQDSADQQRKDIQSSYDKQSAQNQSAFESKMAEIDTEKKAAINKAQTDFSTALNGWKNDYDSWKATKEADITAQLKQLNDQVSATKTANDQAQANVDALQKKINDTIQEWNNVEFPKFVTQDQFKDGLAKKASGLKVRGLRGDYVMAVNATDSNIDATPSTQQAGLVDSGVLAAAVQALADAILDKNHYTKQEADNIKQNILDTINNKTKDMATTQDVAADAQRITALENAGFAKLKLDGFTSAADAQKWSADQHGISMFADEPETV